MNTATAEQPTLDAPAEFTEEQARQWLASNDGTSIRLLAKLWGWHRSRVERFLRRVKGETVSLLSRETPETPAETVAETPPVSAETPETPETPDDDPDDDFDFKRSECILPPRSSVFAYIDDNGDLRISASDACQQCDTEIRINSEDIVDFIDRLTDLVRWPSVPSPVSE